MITILQNSKLEITAIAPNPLDKGNKTSSYKISPKIIDQSILCVCRSEVYLITLGQRSPIFNSIFLNKVFDAVSVKDASVKLAENKKDIIFTCAFYENPIFVGRFWFIFLKRLNSKGKIRAGKNEFKGDLDTISTTTGELSLYWFFRSNITNGISDVETNTNYGTILTIPSTSNNYGVQFAFFNSSENSFYFRKKNGGTWNTWKKIS